MTGKNSTGERIVRRWKKNDRQECRISLLRRKDGELKVHYRYFSLGADGAAYPTNRGIAFSPEDAGELAAGSAVLAALCSGRDNSLLASIR
jgi:hypothetical protein